MAKKAAKTHPKPAVPDSFPLSWHKGKGFWFKKINGKQIRFGTSKDSEEAIRDYEQHRSLAEQGIPRDEWGPIKGANRKTMTDLCRAFLDGKMESAMRPDSGTTSGSVPEIEKLCRRWVKLIGNVPCEAFQNDHLHELIPGGYADATTFRMKNHLREMLNSRIAERFGVRKLLLDLDDHVPLESEDQRIATRVRTKRALTQKEVRTLLLHANDRLKSWILLGVNAAMGSIDLARLQTKDIDGCWLDNARQKRWTWRRACLWPETLDAIERAKAPKNDGNLLLLTRDGGILAYDEKNGDHCCPCGEVERKWVMKGQDWTCPKCGTAIEAKKVRPINQQGTVKSAPGEGFKKLARRLVRDGKLKDDSIAFGLCRHTFESRAAGLRSHHQLAVDLVMGHKGKGISKWYKHSKPDQILYNISSELRLWLFPNADPMPPLVLDESYDERFDETDDETFEE